MRCRCGNEIQHVPEHLRDLANWVCQQCTNVPTQNGAIETMSERRVRKQMAEEAKKRAA